VTRPDADFRSAFGVHVGVIAVGFTPPVASAIGIVGIDRLYPVALAVFSAVAALGWYAVGRWRGGPERLGSTAARYGFAAVPVGCFAAIIVGSTVFHTPSSGVGGAFFGGTGSLLTGLLLAMMARSRYVAAICDDREPLAVWRAKTAPRARRRRSVVGGLGFALGLALAVGGPSLDRPIVGGVGNLLVGVSAATVGALVRDDTFRAHAFGLEIVPPVGRRFLPWDRIVGYRLTDDELRLERRWRPAYRCDRTEIEDVDAVVAALQRAL
jgi:hypothetical protein